MHREDKKQNQDQHIKYFATSQDTVEQFWNNFFRDNFSDAYRTATELRQIAVIDTDRDYASCLQAKVLLRQGQLSLAKEAIAKTSDHNSLKLFINFLLDANPQPLITTTNKDVDTRIYKAQCILLSRIYWGEQYLANIGGQEDPDELLAEVFDELIEEKEYDKAILSSVQTIELTLEDQILSHDLHLPIIHEHLNNLLELANKAKYSSTKAKLFLLKSRIFKDREAAEDAEILFGKDNNKNGLAETYMHYAKEFSEFEYYEKAVKLFNETDNYISQGFIYEALASIALINGEIKEANHFFDKAREKLNRGGIFEHYGLEVQHISLLAIRGKYQKVKEAVHELIKPTIPSFFIAQAYQILANTLVQLGEDIETAKAYIEIACDIFKQLKRFNQLLYTQNVYFQILLLENDLDKIQKTGQEIIQLATRLGNEEIKATKYLDLAFVTIRVSLEEGSLTPEKIAEATDYFKKAINLYQEQGNLIGEADTYQAMGNMFTGIGKLEEALNAFLTAKKLYVAEKATLQASITDTLIGILMLNYVVLNEQTYPIALRHLEQALVYFAKENLLDLQWKCTFYLADLNHKYYILKSDTGEAEVYKNKAKNGYLEMLVAIQDYEEDAPSLLANQTSLVGVTVEDAYNKAYQFFLTIGEDSIARKFRRLNN